MSPNTALSRLLARTSLSAVALFAASSAAFAVCDPAAEQAHHYLPANIDTVQQGFFSKNLTPLMSVNSGDFVTVEMVTHHADKDPRMSVNDPGVESIFAERTSGHILTGPIEVCGAEPGDVLEVRILDLYPRPSKDPEAHGKTYGANVAGGAGFLYNPVVNEVAEDELLPRAVTIYEIDASGIRNWARADHSFLLDTDEDSTNTEVLTGVRVPIRPHFGIMGIAPAEADRAISGPPSYTGGNIDDWRIGKGATMYYPVSVPGALLVAGDPHGAQGDAELSGTAIEMSLTGVVQIVLHKAADNAGTVVEDLDYPLLETPEEFIVHGFSYANYLADLGEDQQEAQDTIYAESSLNTAMLDASRKMLGFLTDRIGLSHDEAYSLMSVSVDFGVTQVANGNWGVHATLKKSTLGELDTLGAALTQNE